MADRVQAVPADLSFYREEVAPVLPPRILDFHTHVWSAATRRLRPAESGTPGARYMVTAEEYPPDALLADGRRCFPDREYQAVCFGNPTPAVDWRSDCAFVAAAAQRRPGLWPLLLAGPALQVDRAGYEEALGQGVFFGFKVFLNWFGDDYGDLGVADMVGPTEIALANERRYILLLHVPGCGRLADPLVQAGVRRLAARCGEAAIILAHCGRCYLPSEMKRAVGAIADLPNVWMDTSMVMDPVVIRIALDRIGPHRLVFGTDFPVAAMRGRRVRVMQHWVDVVRPGYPQSDFRVSGDIPAGFMAWEIVLAIRWGAEMAGVPEADVHGMFWNNGMRLLQRVRR